MSKIIVGVERSERSKDAVALAALLARDSGAEIVLVCAYPYGDMPARVSDGGDFRRFLREDAETAIADAQHAIPGLGKVRRITIAQTSPAKGIQTIAAREDAALIVIGSSHRGATGRVLAGTTAERLLHGAPCPVAVAPLGFHSDPEPSIATIGVAYDGSAEAQAALAGGTAIARALGAQLQVIKVVDKVMIAAPGLMSGPHYELPSEEVEASARERLAEFVAALSPEVAADPVVRVGDPEHELSELSGALDLIVVGSRGYGPHRAVLLGSVSGRLARDAACPVLVVPRGIEAPLEELFTTSAGTEVA